MFLKSVLIVGKLRQSNVGGWGIIMFVDCSVVNGLGKGYCKMKEGVVSAQNVSLA